MLSMNCILHHVAAARSNRKLSFIWLSINSSTRLLSTSSDTAIPDSDASRIMSPSLIKTSTTSSLSTTQKPISNVHLSPLTPIIMYDGQKRDISQIRRPSDRPLYNLNPLQAWIQSFTTGNPIGMMELDPSVFGVFPIRQDLVRRAIDYELSWLEQGTESSKNLGQVRGSTVKRVAQKGRGAARHGTFRANQMRGGYTAHGPRPHIKTIEIPTKVYHYGIRSALSIKYLQNQLLIVDTLSLPGSKTLKFDLHRRLASLKLAGKSSFFLVGSDEPALSLQEAADMFETKRLNSGKKEKSLMVANARHVTAHPLMINEFVVVDKTAVEVLEEIYHVD